jgi:hypothetical protein
MTSKTRSLPLPLALQLELTLATPPTQVAQQTRATRPGDDDWRLDEATRCIGQRGVAIARALLAEGASGSGATGEDRGGRRIDPDLESGRAGRAA